jgi:pimeloyl-ACP methyl ester carboxylesterase
MRFRPSQWWVLVPMLAGLWIVLDRQRPHASHTAEWLDAGGILVRAVRAGKGDTTLLLLHGYGESLTTWRAIFDRLAGRSKVIAIDLPGFGGSAKPDTSYSLSAMTDRLSSFMDRWIAGPGGDRRTLHGRRARHVARLARPDRIKLVILIAPAGYRIGLGGLADSMYPAKARRLGRYLAYRSFITPIHDPDWLAEPDSAANYDQTGDTSYAKAAARVLEDFDFRGLKNRFQDLTQPTLLIWGGNDPVVPYLVGDTLSRLIPCVRFVRLSDGLPPPPRRNARHRHFGDPDLPGPSRMWC